METILSNSFDKCKFVEPKNISLFFSFDNIQKLLKSYRIGGSNQDKPLAVVVTSVLAMLPDGKKESNIQYIAENSPENWFHDVKIDNKKQIPFENLDPSVLKSTIKNIKEESPKLSKIFIDGLATAIAYVEKDMESNETDSIDQEIIHINQKRQKMCLNGHTNKNINALRKYCNICKSPLEQNVESVGISIKESEVKETHGKRLCDKSVLHPNIENHILEETPIAMAVGAIAINPNTYERISYVLEEIQKAANIHRKPAYKLVFEEGKIVKRQINTNEDRKFVIVTSDGLPYKIMIQIIKNTHTCIKCNKDLISMSDMSEHMKKKHHTEFYQKFGNILSNIGKFHYCLTMLRSYVKLLWNIDYSELVKAIHFESPKAQFVQLKVTDYRSSLDTFRIIREAKLRELVYPFVKYARQNNIA